MKSFVSAFAIALLLSSPVSATTAQENLDNHRLVLKQTNACIAFYSRSLQSQSDNGKAVMATNLGMFRQKVNEYVVANNLQDMNRDEEAAWEKAFSNSSEMINGYSVFSEKHPTRKYCDQLSVTLSPIKMERVEYDWIAEGKANSRRLDRQYEFASISMQCVETDNFCHETDTCEMPYKIGRDIKIDVKNQEFFDLTNNVRVYSIDKEYVPLDRQNFFSNLDIGTKYNMPTISFLNFERSGGTATLRTRHIFEPRFSDPFKNKFTGKKNSGSIEYEYKISVYPKGGSLKMSYIRGTCILSGYDN